MSRGTAGELYLGGWAVVWDRPAVPTTGWADDSLAQHPNFAGAHVQVGGDGEHEPGAAARTGLYLTTRI